MSCQTQWSTVTNLGEFCRVLLFIHLIMNIAVYTVHVFIIPPICYVFIHVQVSCVSYNSVHIFIIPPICYVFVHVQVSCVSYNSVHIFIIPPICYVFVHVQVSCVSHNSHVME